MLTAADRKYLWWTLTLFALLGLVGAGTLLYKPLKLRYAIYRLEHTDPEEGTQGRLNAAYALWIDDVAHGARSGNVLAMRTLVKQLSLSQARRLPIYDSAGWVAFSQPDLFIQELAKLPDDGVKMGLWRLLNDMSAYDDPVPSSWPKVQLRGFAKDLETRLESKNPGIRKAAAVSLDFMKRRFAKELAETEKAEKAAPKPKDPAP
jgi:hypothetical protein